MHTKSITFAVLASVLGASATYEAPPSTEPWKVTSAPAPPVKQGPKSIYATFQGANPPVAQFEASIPADGSEYYISNPLSISHIVTDGGPCTFFGVDGLVLNKPASGLVDVGPPQTIVKAVCQAESGYKKAKRFVS